MIKLPRLLNSSMQEVARLEPSSLSIELKMAPLSSATMTLPEDQPQVETGAFIELFTAYGSAGIFRVQQTEQSYGGETTLYLQHGLVTLSDALIPGESEDMTNTPKEILTTLLKNQSMWTLGTCAVPSSTTLTWSYDYSNLQESVLDILDELPEYMATFDQSALPWKINIVALTDEEASECRLTRNISSLTVETDRSELCTRLYVEGLESPLDADTIGTYGVVARSMSVEDDDLSAEDRTTEGKSYLEDHKHPEITITISALDLSAATGESLDAFHLGKMCRVCLPDYGRTITQRIVTLAWEDIISDPESVLVTLASEAETTADALAGLIVETSVVKNKLYDQINDLKVVAETIDLHAEKFIHLQAGVDENASHILLLENQITLKADLILLDGYVKAADLETETLKVLNSARVPDLKALAFNCSGKGSISEFSATTAIIGGLAAGSITIEGSPVATQAWCLSQFAPKE